MLSLLIKILLTLIVFCLNEVSIIIKYGKAILGICIFVGGGCFQTMGQNGFTVISSESVHSAYCYGQPFFRQYGIELLVSEALEQSYLLTDTVIVEICGHDIYHDYGLEYGETAAPGFYEEKRYSHEGANHYDSIFVHRLTIHPVYRRVDTLLLFADDLQGYSVGFNEYNGYSQFGCDSISQIMVYGISCAENYDATAQYGEQEVVLEDIAGPLITPFSPDIRTSLSRAATIRVGETEQLTWHIILSDDTVNCTQNIHVAYPPCGSDYTATDGDGHIYPTIRIGANCWLRKNLSSQHYVQDGRAVAKAGIYRSDMMPDTTSNLENFGRLYSWYSAIGIRENSNDIPISTPNGEIQGICPNGWHIPNLAELSSLNCCSAIALKNNILWIGEATNESNFSALPAGSFNSVKDRYEYIRSHTFLWSSESDSPLSACTAALTYYCDQSLILNQRSKNDRCSVRCVKN